ESGAPTMTREDEERGGSTRAMRRAATAIPRPRGRRPASRSVLAAGIFCACLALTGAALAAEPPPAGTSARGDAATGATGDRLVFLLQYVGADYGLAVRDGEPANPFEYAELLAF